MLYMPYGDTQQITPNLLGLHTEYRGSFLPLPLLLMLYDMIKVEHEDENILAHLAAKGPI